jgi:alkanesulfonate monooxygenase SsuD/methylene tetrahydromethanopterin reductase-like flavin-dependent oxidoreductase (luciferase family)
MQIGTGLVVLPLHHPIEVAEHFATLDTITDAPLIAGIGAGYRDVEFEKFEVPKDERGGRLREGAEILEALWTGPNVTYDGDYYTLENATINPRPSIKPSLWVGASSKAAVRRAAACGDALFLGPRDPISRVDAFMETYATEVGPEDGGSVTMFRDAVVAPTREDAIATGREYLLSKYERYLEWGREGIDLENEFLDIATDRFILGTPDDAIKEIYRYKNLGIDGILFRIQWPGMPNEEAVQTIQLLGDEVLPSI